MLDTVYHKTLNKEYHYAKNAIKRANNLFDIESTDLKKRTNYKIEGNILLLGNSFPFSSTSSKLI